MQDNPAQRATRPPQTPPAAPRPSALPLYRRAEVSERGRIALHRQPEPLSAPEPQPDDFGTVPTRDAHAERSRRRLPSTRVADFAVSAGLREAVLTAYPAARLDEPLRRFLCYVLFRARYDEGTGRVVVCGAMLSDCMGMHDKYRAGNCKGPHTTGAFLERLKADLPGLDYTGYHLSSGSARTLRESGIDPAIWDAVERELDEPPNKGRVLFVSGRVYNGAARREATAKAAEGVAHFEHAAKLPEQARLLRYLNRLDGPLTTQTFTSVLRHLPEAFALIRQMRAEGEWTDEVARQERRKLHAIDQQPRPFYGLSARGRTVRVLPLGESLMTLKRELRAVMLQDFHGADLKSAQAAIAAWRWGIEPLNALLARGGSLWAALAKPVGDGYKGPHKTGFYAITFCAEEGDVPFLMRVEFRKRRGGFLSATVTTAFMAHPLVRATLEAREVALTRVQEAGGASDAFGDWQAVEGDREARDVLGSVMQSWEFRLMQPVAEMAVAEGQRDRPEFWLVGWLHDGVYFKVRRRDRAGETLARIAEAVDSGARTLGVHTSLEVEEARSSALRLPRP